MELIHRTSLVYDDIQDHSPQRNHRDTVWRVYGVDQALNAGLALSCYGRLALQGMLEALVAAAQGGDPLLHMCRYHLGLEEVDGDPSRAAAGKMLRPALCLAMCETLGGVVDDCLPAALSVEIAHRTSLVFDDIQDNSPQRYHRDTPWAVYGVDQTLNAGLSLSGYGRLAIQGMLGLIDPSTILVVERELEHAVIDLRRGQYMDLHFQGTLPSLAQYPEMVRLKTGVLMGVACQVGALGAGEMGRATDALCFGERLGVAFPLQDDYLGVWGQSETPGKAPNDLQERKRGLPVVLARQAKPEAVASRVATPGEAATAELMGLLETLGIRPRAQALAQEAAGGALRALKRLHLRPPWESLFEQLVQFVVGWAV